MIEIAEAIAHVLQHTKPIGTEVVELDRAYGRILQETVQSDVDSPPHDKALMDGFAIRSADFQSSQVKLKMVEEITAGQVPQCNVESGTCSRIMTGAPIPAGADSVVMVERSQVDLSDPNAPIVELSEENTTAGQNIMRRAASMKKGEEILSLGKCLSAADVGVLAEVGKSRVTVACQPKVGILATGNELVPCDQIPQPGHIRNSNGPMLVSLTQSAGAEPIQLGIASDDEPTLRQHIEQGLAHDILLLSGGVSAGVLDLVPSVLISLGVEQVFHKVNLKPGKPIFFGIKNHGSRVTLVFGLPGNPVSSLVGFYLFVQQAMRAMTGLDVPEMEPAKMGVEGQLAESFTQRTARPTYWPSQAILASGRLMIHPLAWKGSADQRTLAKANALAFFPGEAREFSPGEAIRMIPWDATVLGG